MPLITALSEAERNLAGLASLGGRLPLTHLLTQPFLRREAVISSRIEGTRASLADEILHTIEKTIPHN